MPEFELEDVEDAYTYYVSVMGISEDIFWHADVAFVKSVVANKAAYDAWLASEQRAAAERARRENA